MTTIKRGRKSVASLHAVALGPLRRPPMPPEGMSKPATDLWNEIAASVPTDYFRPGDLPLLQAYCVSYCRKRTMDTAILEQGIMFDGAVHPGLKVSRDEATLMASLAVKLRLCQSARTRPESAGLKVAHVGPRPWDDMDPAAEFFDRPNSRL